MGALLAFILTRPLFREARIADSGTHFASHRARVANGNALPHDTCQTLVINLLPSQIAEVSVIDFNNPERSYTLTLDTLGNATLRNTHANEELTNLDSSRVRRYLSYFSEFNAERCATELSEDEYEEMLRFNYAYTISITSHDGNKQNIGILHMPASEEYDIFGRPTTVDLDRCYLANGNNPYWLVALWADIDLLIKDVDFFMK